MVELLVLTIPEMLLKGWLILAQLCSKGYIVTDHSFRLKAQCTGRVAGTTARVLGFNPVLVTCPVKCLIL